MQRELAVVEVKEFLVPRAKLVDGASFSKPPPQHARLYRDSGGGKTSRRDTPESSLHLGHKTRPTSIASQVILQKMQWNLRYGCGRSSFTNSRRDSQRPSLCSSAPRSVLTSASIFSRAAISLGWNNHDLDRTLPRRKRPTNAAFDAPFSGRLSITSAHNSSTSIATMPSRCWPLEK